MIPSSICRCLRVGVEHRAERRGQCAGRRPCADGGAALLKVHRPRGPLDRLRSRLLRSRARAEWDAARYLAAAGIPVAAPLAVAERGGEAFFAARFLEGARALDDPPPPSHVLLAQVARAVRRVHDRGFDHRDLHAGNLLRAPAGSATATDTAAVETVVTDLHRARWGRPVADARRWAALAKLAHSLGAAGGDGGAEASTGEATVLTLLAAYDPDVSADDLRRRSRVVANRVERIERTRRKSRAKRTEKESTVYTQDAALGGTRRRDLPIERIERALVEHDAALAAGDARVAKRNRRGAVTAHGDLVVKEAAPREAFARLRARLAPGRARSAFRNAHRLSVLGIDTATPLAFVRRDGRAFTLLEDLSHRPRLDHVARALFPTAATSPAPHGTGAAPEPRAAQRGLLEESARWLATLHRRGVYHGDLKGVNVRVAPPAASPAGASDDRWRFFLIDTDRCRFTARGVSRRHRLKNLAQLAASIPRGVTRADRLRWWRRYAAGTDLLAEERRVAREVAALLARKTVVVDEPIE